MEEEAKSDIVFNEYQRIIKCDLVIEIVICMQKDQDILGENEMIHLQSD